MRGGTLIVGGFSFIFSLCWLEKKIDGCSLLRGKEEGSFMVVVQAMESRLRTSYSSIKKSFGRNLKEVEERHRILCAFPVRRGFA